MILQKYWYLEVVFKIAIAALILFMFVAKAYWLQRSTDSIGLELIEKTKLSTKGVEAANRLYEDKLTAAELCSETRCETPETTAESKILVDHRAFVASLAKESDKVEVLNYVKANGLPLAPPASFRGRFIHHYNTILYPFSEARNGNLGYLLTAQNGLISILPLFLMRGLPFIDYPLFGISVTFLVFAFFLAKYLKSQEFYSIAAVSFLVALTLSEAAMRIHPGFSYIRFFPTIAMMFLIAGLIRVNQVTAVVLVGICAFLNAEQFNVLVLAIIGCLYVTQLVVNRERLDILCFFAAAILAVVGLQVWLFDYEKNIFSTSLFGSVGEGIWQKKFTFFVALTPSSILMTRAIFSKISFSREALVGYISYFAFSTYAITQVFSPQHFSGFVFMAAISVVLLLRTLPTLTLRVIPVALFVIFPAYPYSYHSKPKRMDVEGVGFYTMSNFDSALKFSTYTDFGPAIAEFEQLKAKYGIGADKFYFLSKDKIYFETKLDRIIQPSGYDVYVATNLNSDVHLEEKLKSQGIQYLIIDSALQRRTEKLYVKFAAKEIGNASETERYLELLLQYDGFAQKFSKFNIGCSQRYCVFKFE